MGDTGKRYCETEHYRIGNTDWFTYRRILMPVSAPHIPVFPDIKTIKRLTLKKHLLGAIWTYDWDCEPTPWYWTACDNDAYHIDGLNKKDRRDIRVGIKKTTVRPCTFEWISKHGYDVYKKAFDRYIYAKPKPYNMFCNELFKLADVAEPEGWAVFHEGKLIAWLSTYIRDNVVLLDDLKFDPDYRSCYPTNAALYEVTSYYLLERRCKYITAGSRNVSHPTSMHDFLVRALGWRKIYCRLGLWLRSEIRLPLHLGFGKLSILIERLPFLGLVGRNLMSADLLWRISNACGRKEYPESLKNEINILKDVH